MANAQTTEVFNCSVPEFYKIIADYERYPEFLSEVKECKILKNDGNRKLVEYNIAIPGMGNTNYSIQVSEIPDQEISWQLASGKIFKSMSGYWKLADEAGKTRASYSVDANFGLLVPGFVAKALVSVNLPSMMSSYHKRVAELYGK